ncbi:bifunctional 5,10-methylenetetrahydrofolate dehydrogenase/5,10-methenyltetrahydrofolate cyclohydrolase [Patescibacteria group bacterium]|nr:bifunctional 5,10-methylenetetrahydrofolate dehydrogenase/5,10-methenyltetrahydrofolate cyclohydrolase [Patescibacteria group bacterium]
MTQQQTIIFDGQKAAQKILEEIKSKVSSKDKKPGLAAILIGDDRPSHIYVKNKEKACQFCDITFHKYFLEENTPQKELLCCIEFLNKDPDIDAIIVQLPLPKQFDVEKVISSIDPKKDVDGFHPQTIKDIMAGKPGINSALVQAIREILKQTEQDLNGKKMILVSNCDIFYNTFVKELEDLMLDIEVIFSDNKKLEQKTKSAEILVSAVGKAKFITRSMVKKDAIVIDVGTSLVGKKFVGDVNFEEVKKIASFITPVPGGVGPMTVAMLLKNVYELSQNN